MSCFWKCGPLGRKNSLKYQRNFRGGKGSRYKLSFKRQFAGLCKEMLSLNGLSLSGAVTDSFSYLCFLYFLQRALWGTVPSVGNVAQTPLGKASGE